MTFTTNNGEKTYELVHVCPNNKALWHSVTSIYKDDRAQYDEGKQKKVHFKIVNEERSNKIRQPIEENYVMVIDYIDDVVSTFNVYKELE